MRSNARLWPWHLLLAAILIAMAAGLWGATERMDYTWRWNRVPEYFAYHAEQLHKAPFDAVVAGIAKQGEVARVTLRGEDGTEQALEVAAGSVQVYEGEELFEGDFVGSTFSWRPGPLAAEQHSAADRLHRRNGRLHIPCAAATARRGEQDEDGGKTDEYA